MIHSAGKTLFGCTFGALSITVMDGAYDPPNFAIDTIGQFETGLLASTTLPRNTRDTTNTETTLTKYGGWDSEAAAMPVALTDVPAGGRRAVLWHPL